MRKVKEAFNYVTYNIKTLVGFELFYKVVTLLVFSPLFLNLFNLIMRITGYDYLTFENFATFLLNPITLILLVILILLLLVYTMFDITAIIVILDMSYHKKKISIRETIAISLLKIKRIFRIDNMLLACFVLVLIPFLNFGLSGGIITSLSLPEYVIDYINKNIIYLSLFIILMIFLFLICLKCLYALHYIILEDKNFKEARKKSYALSKKNILKDAIAYGIMFLLSSVIYIILTFVGVFIIVIIDKMFGKWLLIKSFVTAITWIFLAILLIVYILLSTPICYSLISVLYYQHKIDNNEKIGQLKYNKKKEKNINNRIVRYLAPCLIVLALVFGTFFTYEMYKGKYNFNIEYVRVVEVTAHRGASTLYPENTMLAFVGAKEMGADWIELDVQQTKDKQIVVLHDSNLKRITGLDKEVWEVEYSEIQELDAGSYFGKLYKDERVPLLEDVMKWASQNNMKLNIEIKPTGHEVNIEEDVVKIVKKYGFIKEIIITSHDYGVLEKVKDYNMNVKTAYVTGFAYGKITKMDKADAFSVESSSINEELVTRVHNAGKELYAWTVNSEDSIKKMVYLNVDNVITDDVVLAKEMIYESKNSNLVNEFIRIMTELLA